ncbi:sphingosine-1-phosphate lyase [Zophobas morio]|uniref:sphingosine-1-phosphate lyase n=1 Tax=Zophobas morio TaxID=2755281 RepID=UPI003083C6F3
MDTVLKPLTNLKLGLNNTFAGKEPWQIVTYTTTTVLFVVWLHDFVHQDESVVQRAKKTVFKLAKLIPSIRQRIDNELKSVRETFEKSTIEKTKHLTYTTSLPSKRLSPEEILDVVKEHLKLGDYDWKGGLVSGTVYYHNPDLIKLITDVYGMTSYTNPLHPDVFLGLCKMESEVVRMACNLFHGDENACGTMTTGGTESILMACKAYRDYAREVKGIRKPEIVLPKTAHSAFDKAAQYFRLKVRAIPVDPVTTKVNIRAMKRAINCNTIMLVGSAPNFPYGTMDDISEISALGVKYNVPVHVDSCLGGFLTVFMEDAGYPVPLCDFRLPGVTSISADTHKYGFAPKGSSVILYRDVKYRHHQFTVTTDWPGGVYGSPTVCGSRAGGNIAVCWAAMLSFGKEGYIQATRDIIHTTHYIEKGLRRMKGIFIFGQPATSVIALGSEDFNIYRLGGALNDLGWNLNVLQFPSGIHLTVTHVHTQQGVADKFLNDVQNSLTEILKTPDVPVEGKMAIYGVAQSLPDRSIVTDFTRVFLDSMYYTPKQ